MRAIVILFVCLFIIIPFCATAELVTPAQEEGKLGTQGTIVLSALWQDVHHEEFPDGKLPPEPVPAPQPPVVVPVVAPSPAPVIIPTPTPVPPSRGETKVQEMLRQNREKLQQLRQQQAQENQRQKEEELDNQKGTFSDRMHKKEVAFREGAQKHVEDSLTAWKKQVQETYQRWKEEHDKFLGRVDDYKESKILFSAEAPELPKKELQQGIPLQKIPHKYYVVKGALDVKIKDQGKRPTCSSFAGIRGVEILLAQQNKFRPLSEQYFYWLSKPNCQFNNCSVRGSWVVPGFEQSKNAARPDIPTEESCPYQNFPQSGNETQIPLASSCRQQGVVKVVDFEYVSSLPDILNALKRNQPVVGGFRLNDAFYITQGLVKMQDAGGKVSTREHAAAHAMIIVGFMELPSSMLAQEGRYCLLIANSWGEGFGKGGHACITEEWFKQYRMPQAFVALKALEI